MRGYRNEDGTIPADTYLESLNVLLTDDAADWAESHPDAIRLLSDPEPTQATVENFKALFCERFPTKAVEITPVPFDVELADLRQKPEEPLVAYYKRTTGLMQRVGLKDRQVATPLPTLTSVESAMLDTVMRAFIRGLANPEIRMEATRAMASGDRSLRMIYNLAEEARRTNIEIQKLHDEESKTDELQFYKDLVQKNLPKHQVASLLASHQASKQTQQTPVHQPPHYQSWSFPSEQSRPSSEPPVEAFRNRFQSQQPTNDRRPSYQSEAPPVLASNPNKSNVGRGGFTGPTRRHYQPTPKEIPDRSTSRNPYINGSTTWSFKKDGQLCVKCGTPGHGSPSCDNSPLPAWEQSYLKMIVFGENPQSNFAAVGLGAYDGAIQPYGAGPGLGSRKPSTTSSSSSSQGQDTPMSSSICSSIDSIISSSVQFGIAGLAIHSYTESKAVEVAEANLGEGSGPNKRAHVEDEPLPDQPRPATKRQVPEPLLPNNIQLPNQVPQAAQLPLPNQIPQHTQVPLPTQTGMNQAPPLMPNPSAAFPFPFQAENERTKMKGRKRVGKKSEPQPLVGMFNGQQYDSPMSVRQILQHHKVDMTFLDLVAWSPAICKELKRLCTRVPKRRMPKPSAPPVIPVQPFQPTYNQAPGIPGFQPMQYQPMQVPYQTHQPMQSQASSQQTLGGRLSQAISSSVGAASNLDPERQTRFLGTLVGAEKAFRVPSTVRKPTGEEVELEKSRSQADQGSDMNVISQGMVRFLGLKLHLLSDIGFKGLSMRTADHRDTVLMYWVWLDISVEGIWRKIRCFVAPEVVSVNEAGRAEYLSLILGIPWLYSVDASISIRLSTIFVGDRTIGEEVREVVGPELVFCHDHNLLMYPKSAMVRGLPQATIEEIDESASSSESSDSGDELSDIEDDEVVPKEQDFQ